MKRILYVEDEQEQVELMRERLKMEGYELISAKDGAEGLAMAQKEKPDLVLLDLFLPKIKGFEVCKHLKEREETRHMPVIIITASGVEHIDDQCRNVGADDYIKKPYESKELITKIKMMLHD